MRTLLVGIAVAVALTVGIGAALTVGGIGSDETTTTETDDGLGVPAEVLETRAAILAAAGSGDYEALRALIPSGGFEYTFGGPVEGGPVAYWQELERTTEEQPLETLATILRMPYVLSRGSFVWPWAYTVENQADLSPYERELLAPLGPLDQLVIDGTGYLGYRTGIEPDGDWTFFVAGD
jgi:hypothetical protein